MKNQKNYSFWDTQKSTFVNKIHFKNGNSIIGYSKTKKMDEGHDKIVVLEKWIVRLREGKNNYFHPDNVEKLEFFLNKNNYECYHIMTLYPDNFRLNKDMGMFKDNRLRDFLYSFYKNPTIKMNPHKPKPINEDEIFSISSKRFNNNQELIMFCLKQAKNGFEEQRILSFYNQYSNKFL
jgi:hypothetical protein